MPDWWLVLQRNCH